MVAPIDQEKGFTARNGGPTYMARRLFCKPIHTKEERNGQPKALYNALEMLPFS